MDKETGIYFIVDPSLNEVHRTFYKMFEYILGLEMLLQDRTKVCSLDLNSDHNHLLFSIAGLLCYTRNELMHTNYYRYIYQED